MKNILIIGAGKGMGKSLVENIKIFDQIYTMSRGNSFCLEGTKHIQSDTSKEIDVTDLPKNSIDLMIYIPSLWGAESKMNGVEFDDYMAVGPKGLLNAFNKLKDNEKLTDNALIVSIGSTAGETAQQISTNPSSSIYSMAKLTQNALIIQLMQKYKQYRFFNFTLGSIGLAEEGLGYLNIASTIKHVYEMKNGVRYSEITLVPDIDVQ